MRLLQCGQFTLEAEAGPGAGYSVVLGASCCPHMAPASTAARQQEPFWGYTLQGQPVDCASLAR